MDRAIYTFKVAAEESTRIPGEYLSLDTLEATAGRWGIVRRFPIGPIFGITPFNFPLNLVAHKLAPAIAAACPIILKLLRRRRFRHSSWRTSFTRQVGLRAPLR